MSYHPARYPLVGCCSLLSICGAVSHTALYSISHVAWQEGTNPSAAGFTLASRLTRASTPPPHRSPPSRRGVRSAAQACARRLSACTLYSSSESHFYAYVYSYSSHGVCRKHDCKCADAARFTRRLRADKALAIDDAVSDWTQKLKQKYFSEYKSALQPPSTRGVP